MNVGPVLPFPSLSLHVLPLWFLVLALFVPRIALIAAWFEGVLIPFHLDFVASPVLAVLLPRLLVMALIYLDQGLDQWFLAHAVVALLVFTGFHHHKKVEIPRGVEEMNMRRRRPGRVPEWRM